MRVKREELNKVFETAVIRYASDQDDIQKIMMHCYKEWNYPFFRSQTVLHMEASSAELKDVEIFWILSAINATSGESKIPLEPVAQGFDTAAVNMVLNLQRLQVKRPDKYIIRLLVDGEELASLPLYALEAPQQGGQAPDAPIAQGEQDLPN